MNLTKREYFAGLAMQNLQNILLRKSGSDQHKRLMEENGFINEREMIATLAVMQADALIEALGEDKTPIIPDENLP